MILLRDHARCRVCGREKRPGSAGAIYAAHILPKGQYPALRYELLNVLAMCYYHHMEWWHKNPTEAWEWLTTELGEGAVARLRLWSKTRKKADRGAERLYLTAERDRLARVA